MDQVGAAHLVRARLGTERRRDLRDGRAQRGHRPRLRRRTPYLPAATAGHRAHRQAVERAERSRVLAIRGHRQRRPRGRAPRPSLRRHRPQGIVLEDGLPQPARRGGVAGPAIALRHAAKTRGAPLRDDSCLYEPEAIRVGLILFAPKTCSACGAVLPANIDYYTPDCRCGGLLAECRMCRRCRRERQRVANHALYWRRKARAET